MTERTIILRGTQIMYKEIKELQKDTEMGSKDEWELITKRECEKDLEEERRRQRKRENERYHYRETEKD